MKVIELIENIVLLIQFTINYFVSFDATKESFRLFGFPFRMV